MALPKAPAWQAYHFYRGLPGDKNKDNKARLGKVFVSDSVIQILEAFVATDVVLTLSFCELV